MTFAAAQNMPPPAMINVPVSRWKIALKGPMGREPRQGNLTRDYNC